MVGCWESGVDSFLRELRVAARQLRKSPGFAITAVLVLAFGIGATTAIFAVVDRVLLRPLSFPHADRPATLGDQIEGADWGKAWGKQDQGPVTAPEVVTYQRELHSFSSLGGYEYLGVNLSGVGQPTVVQAAPMTPSVFAALGVAPLMGRVFTKQEATQDAQVAVLSYRVWKPQFNGNPHILGTKIWLDRYPYVVIGVMPRNFVFPMTYGPQYYCALWIPLAFSPHDLGPGAYWSWSLWVVGRLKPGVTTGQAEAEADLVAQQIMRKYPPDVSNFRIHPVVYPLQQIKVQPARLLLRLLFWAVAVVMLIACANFAGLLLVRAIRRQGETAMRLALGAPAMTLLRQTIAESLLLSGAGGLIGIGLAAFAIYGGRNLLPANLPMTQEITPNWTVAGFAMPAAYICRFWMSLAPGLAAPRRRNARGSAICSPRSASASLILAFSWAITTTSTLSARLPRTWTAFSPLPIPATSGWSWIRRTTLPAVAILLRRFCATGAACSFCT